MKQLFISQPMNGKTDDQILAERDEAIEVAKKYVKEEVEVIDSFFKDFKDTPKSGCIPLKYLAKSLELLGFTILHFPPLVKAANILPTH